MSKDLKILKNIVGNLFFIFIIFSLLSLKDTVVSTNGVEFQLCNTHKIRIVGNELDALKYVSYLDSCAFFVEQRETTKISIEKSNYIPVLNKSFLNSRKLAIESSGFGVHKTSSIFVKKYNERTFYGIIDYKPNFGKVIFNLVTIIGNGGTIDITFRFKDKNIYEVQNEVIRFMNNLYIL